MKHLLNLLNGIADSMNLLGTNPPYTVPQVGDRAADVKNIKGDFAVVGRDMTKAAGRAQKGRAHGEVDNGTASRQRQAPYSRAA